VAVRTSRQPRTSTAPPQHVMAPIGHTRAPQLSRGRLLWTLLMVLVLVVALFAGIMLRDDVAPGGGDLEEPAPTVVSAGDRPTLAF
jgi:Na+/proline symporter